MVNGLFAKPKSKRLAKIITIKSPSGFKKSVKTLSKGGLSLKEFRALNLAKTRAALQLRRKNLSTKERTQFKAIVKVKIPKFKRRK